MGDLTLAATAIVPILAGVFSLLYVIFIKMMHINKATDGTGAQVDIAREIQEGARSFMKTEYKYLSIFVVVTAILLTIILEIEDGGLGWKTAVNFVIGAVLSATAGWMGMDVATQTNVKTTEAAKSSLNGALKIAFKGGAVMGFTVVGLGIGGIGLVLIIFADIEDISDSDLITNDCVTEDHCKMKNAMTYLAGFGFGASAIALFARVAGGIYTKAADVGADLVGKVEQNIPEDDPRNPGVIADNVGDNVGDVAGMGADLFESFVGSIIASATLAKTPAQLALPFWVSGFGVVAAAIGSVFVKTNEGASQKQLLHSLHMGVAIASIGATVGAFVSILILFETTHDDLDEGWKAFGCIMIGMVSGILIGEATERATSYSYYPTQSITNAGVMGHAPVVIQGLGVGMLSCLPPCFIIAIAIVACNELADMYGVAIAAVGMLSTLGMTLATDAYGPIADNAGGIAEMAELPEEVRGRTDALDALGNTTAATGKGFAIGSAVLTAISLMSSFMEKTGLVMINLGDANTLAGLLVGSSLPFFFAAVTMLSVQKAAGAIIEEVRRQFKEIDGLLEGREGVKAESSKCVQISTTASIKEMFIPGVVSVLTPVGIGLFVGSQCLGGLLAGTIGAGFMLAVMMANAGGAWDNAKKYVEIEKAHGGKGTEVHHAVVTGDTVGDPFKDTSGPALNILLKLMSIISLTLAPLFTSKAFDGHHLIWGIIVLVVMTFIIIVYYMKVLRGATFNAARGSVILKEASETE